MNKQELIDKAVEALTGVAPEHARLFITVYGDYVSFPSGYKPVPPHEYICTKSEFQQRARELGWSNGFKPTKNIKPSNWYDYDQQEAITLPPDGTDCEYFKPITQVWCNGKVIAQDDNSEMLWFEGEGLVYAFPKHFRPLDHAKRKAKADKKRVIISAMKACKHTCNESSLSDLYDKGFLKMPEGEK